MRAGLLCIALCLLGCQPAAQPNQTSEAWLARRDMANVVVDIANRARDSGDLEKEVAALDLLVELWADMPEARMGGRWHDVAAESRKVAKYALKLERTRVKGQSMTERLNHSRARLDELGAELEPLVGADPTFSLLTAGILGVRGGWLGRGIAPLVLQSPVDTPTPAVDVPAPGLSPMPGMPPSPGGTLPPAPLAPP